MSGTVREQALTANLMQRAALWRAADARAARLARGRTEDAAEATRLADDYRMLAHDLARARRLLPATRTRAYLEAAYARSHATLHHEARRPGHALLVLLREDIPAETWRLRYYILWSLLCFVLAALAGYALIGRFPELIALFASPDVIASVESGELWTKGMFNVVPSSVLSAAILANNVVVSLFAYCAGVFFGLGTLYILALNGMMLGALFAFVAQHALEGELLRFVVAHGCVEISVMCLSAAAGASLGEALVRPGPQGRMESFRLAALASSKLLLGCALLLVGCGLIEGFISPDPRVSLAARIAIGVGYWLLMLLFLSGGLFGRFTRAAAGAVPRTR
jgi:uncharacterized membrane protein SpoIIM required for sporulation